MSTRDIKVVKIGGHVVEDGVALAAFVHQFASMDCPRILVHGGGAMASDMQRRLGIEPVKIEGRRVTDPETLKIVTMVYGGWCNKHITALLQAAGCDAIGLSGCDGSVVKALRRPPVLLSDGVTRVDFGLVGDVDVQSVDAGFLGMLLDAGKVPVLSAINHDGHGQLLNTNADTVAASVAAAVGGTLVTCFEHDGVLADPSDEGSVIPSITQESFGQLRRRGIVSQGMIPKIEGALAALRSGARSVVIKNASRLLDDTGTTICL